MNITFEQNEIQTLIALIDVAVKAGGLQTAEAGLYFVNKLKSNPMESANGNVERTEPETVG